VLALQIACRLLSAALFSGSKPSNVLLQAATKLERETVVSEIVADTLGAKGDVVLTFDLCCR
jgi:hypothetical protein